MIDAVYGVIIAPVLTEKSTALQKGNKYIFNVHPKSNKMQIKKAVEVLFKVSVASVNILRRPPKKKIFKGKRGTRSGFKKAVVSVLGSKKIDLGL